MNTEQRNYWNGQHEILSGMITKPGAHTEAAAIILELHTALYASEEGNGEQATYEDALWDQLLESTARSYPVQTPGSRNSIVWHLWHSARIEDITMNIVGADREQVLYSGQYARRLGVPYVHSGNGMSEQDVAALSREVNLEALAEYRRAVARRTRSILSALKPGPGTARDEGNSGAVRESPGGESGTRQRAVANGLLGRQDLCRSGTDAGHPA